MFSVDRLPLQPSGLGLSDAMRLRTKHTHRHTHGSSSVSRLVLVLDNQTGSALINKKEKELMSSDSVSGVKSVSFYQLL